MDSFEWKRFTVLYSIYNCTSEILKEINNHPTNQNHSTLEKDLRGYSLLANKNCKFTPIEDMNNWNVLNQILRIFRNGAAHITHIQHMNPSFTEKLKDPTDSIQDYYRYAPHPYIDSISENQLKNIYKFIQEAILVDVRSNTEDINRIRYEINYVEREPLIIFLQKKMIELLKVVKCL